jgi:uncharacterized protein (DUF58 family)
MSASTPAAIDVPYLDYRLRWRASESRPGKHAARQSGAGGEFQAFRPFWQLPDARRIDIRRSIVDPFGDVMVRQTEQRGSITVMLAADLSRSMRPDVARSTLASIARLAQSAARSALRAGDAFGFLGFDREVRPDISLPPTRARGAVRSLIEGLQRFVPDGRGAEGITQLGAHLPPRRCLLLLASDFMIPLTLVETALVTLARHDVAPVALTLDGVPALPRAGLLRLRDAETGQTRLVLLRPGLQRRWQAAEQDRKRALDMMFRRHGRAVFHAGAWLDIGKLSEHLTDV